MPSDKNVDLAPFQGTVGQRHRAMSHAKRRFFDKNVGIFRPFQYDGII